MDYTPIYKKTAQYVTSLFVENKKENLVFHNIDHTKYVVEKVQEIAAHVHLDEREMLILFLAAWFHDTGYLFVKSNEHEAKSAELLKEFLEQEHPEEAIINEAVACIMATKSPRNPYGILQQVICDADTYNFGTKDFKTTNKKVFAELNYFDDHQVSKADFNKQTYEMLKEHEYYTSYCREQLNERKKSNMKKIKKKASIKEEDSTLEITEKEGTTKGMQTMLRLTSSNHIKLSDMADSKANILISVNAIIISVILSILLRKLQTDEYLTIPTIIFLAVSVTTIVIAILATRPKITLGTFNENDIISKKTNLLFFGNFYKVDLNSYEKAMRSMMKDSDYLYRSIIKDIYFLGVVLGKKYRLLRLAYNIFMIGIIVSVIAFALAAFLHTAPPEGTNSVSNATGSPF
ncbi:MAG: Pycsar system effector family protein [Ferruginibacter sp.]